MSHDQKVQEFNERDGIMKWNHYQLRRIKLNKSQLKNLLN